MVRHSSVERPVCCVANDAYGSGADIDHGRHSAMSRPWRSLLEAVVEKSQRLLLRLEITAARLRQRRFKCRSRGGAMIGLARQD